VPAKYSAGVSYKFLPCLVGAFDVEMLQWSHVKALHNPLLDNGVLHPLGANNGPGFGFRDQYFYRVGLEWAINDCWTLRTGFRYANTPVKASQVLVNALTIDLAERFFTWGATYNVNECNEVSFSAAYGFEHSVTGSIPSIAPNVFGGGSAKLKEQKYALGIVWGHKY
jgi:long-chain fatty acid transport protein